MCSQKNLYSVVSILALGLLATLLIQAQQQNPASGAHSQHDTEEMNKRGDKAMGFDHLKTTHHFSLAKDGGSIQVEANDPKDSKSRDQIRGHLHHIAIMFSAGNFAVPMLVHDKTPPGADVMRKLKAEIDYKYEETRRGALIRIATSNANALDAIHQFLRFQIEEHRTGDPMEAPKME
jgi:hypothetical protein